MKNRIAVSWIIPAPAKIYRNDRTISLEVGVRAEPPNSTIIRTGVHFGSSRP
ncbi:MAG TPA: hypothetical protein VGO68_17970 [Pyrinomonadaceae bacterium]|nr:hypothetical protein [Pyrinomonadaceae bacterium]